MRVLVTGCFGFIGFHVSKKLLDLNAEVFGISLLDKYSVDFFKDFSYNLQIEELLNFKSQNALELLQRENFEFIGDDILKTDLEYFITHYKIDYLIHLAGRPGVRDSWDSSFKSYVDNNILATNQLMETAVRCYRIKKVIYASSSSVYGNIDDMSEKVATSPHSPYGVTKLAGEKIVTTYCDNYNIPYTVLRYFSVYGPRQRPDMFFTKLLCDHYLGIPTVVNGDGSQRRDFTYIDDVVTATVSCLSENRTNFEIINIGTEKTTSLIDAINICSNLLNKDSLNIIRGKKQKGDVISTHANIYKAKRLLKYSPKTPLKKGLSLQVAWMNSHLKEKLLELGGQWREERTNIN